MADDNELINQDEIEQLLKQQGGASAPEPAASKQSEQPADDSLSQSDIEALMGGGTAGPAASPQATQTPQSIGDADKLLGQNDIEKLLNQASKTTPQPNQPAVQEKPPMTPVAGEADMAQGDVEYLLRQAEEALASIDNPAANDILPGVTAFRLTELSAAPASTDSTTLDLIRDVELDLKIELGRTHMYLEDVLKLHRGSVVPLDKLAGDPVDIYANGRLIARGEVLVLNDNFCVRVAELIAGANPAD